MPYSIDETESVPDAAARGATSPRPDCVLLADALLDEEARGLRRTSNGNEAGWPELPVVVFMEAEREGRARLRTLLRAGATEVLRPSERTTARLDQMIESAIDRHLATKGGSGRWAFESRGTTAERNLLEAILDAAPTGIIVVDANGKILHMNQANERLWGDAPYSKSIEEYWEWKAWWADGSKRHGRRVLPHEWAMARALAGESVRRDLIELEPFDRPSVRRTMLCSAAPVRDRSGEVVGAVVAQMDITDLVAAQAAMRRNEERYRLVARATNDVIWDWDLQTNRLEWNDAVREHVGCSPEGMGTTLRQWSDRIHPDERESVTLGLLAAIEGSAESWTDEYRFRREDGTYATFLDRGYIARDRLGRAYRMIGSMLNVTERREIERALREADRRKDEFLAVLAHELRNPLAPVRTAVQLLREVGPKDPLLDRARDVIDRQVVHMAKLIDDLLDVSRVTRGTLQLRKERCDLGALVRQTAEDYRASLESNGLRLLLDVSDTPLWIEGDPTRVVQMVTNLLHNAARFTPEGGRVTVRARTNADRSQVVVSVEDTGIGMDRALLARVFDPFCQAEQGLARSKGGLGLGLALTQGLAELHGGTVVAESEGVGRGSTFSICLPLVSPPERVEEARARPAGRDLRIVVIEDNEDSAEILAQLLTLSGHQVQIAFDGRAGLTLVRDVHPDVVISDIGLPGSTDGYEVARTVRAETKDDGPLLIALSGYAQDEDRRRSREAGFDTHLAKPPDLEKLRAMLEDAARREFTRSTHSGSN